MYLLITSKKGKSGKIYRSAKVVESYKTPEGKSRQTVIQNLGPIKSSDDELKFRKIVKNMKKGKEFVDINTMKYVSSKSYGIYYTVSQLFKKFNLDKILKSNLSKGKHQFNVYEVTKALIINRLENPLSKNKAFEYIQKDYPEKIECIKENLYSAMDVLERKKEIIEFEIFQNLKDKLQLDLEHSHYDITSSYFEGHKCEIATYGYNRDGLKGKEQIVIGLVMVDNIPIYHEVFEGNTSDKTTVLDVIKTLKTKFKIKTPTIVGDRGMFTKDIIETIEKNQEKYILGFSKVGNKITEEVLEKEISIPEEEGKKKEHHYAILGKEEVVEYSKENIQIRKYILCIDDNTRKEKLETLDKVKEYILTKSNELYSKYIKSQKKKNGKKMTWESFIRQVGKIMSRNKRLFNDDYKHETQKFELKINENWYKREKIAAGKFILITNGTKSPMEVLKIYKQLNDVESSFNCIKNQLDLRPINHYKNERVKAHVFICVLALLIEKIMTKQLKEMSPQSALEELKRLRVGTFKIGEITKKQLTTLSLKHKEILNQINIVHPVI